MKLFDSHCHLQDPRIFRFAPQVIKTSLDSGVIRFAVNGVSEKDWGLVKQMSDHYSCVIPCFGLHPWFITERSPRWFSTLKEFFENTPYAAVGEIGLDKGSHGRQIDFMDQVEVFQQQLQLAKELKRPASVHCVRAFGDLLEIMKSVGPFPAGVILHSYLGSAEMVPEFAKLGAYFSFSGFLMSMKESKAKKMLRMVPNERILIETDAPDALPTIYSGSLYSVERGAANFEEFPLQERNSASSTSNSGKLHTSVTDTSTEPHETLNHPANIHHVLNYVAALLEMNKEDVAEISCRNAMHLFSYEGSKVLLCG
ncbi:3'-5' ssDNA/RNA exonuclease TatD-like [Dillenia turbinata]|uniref:3'-5' ssDNA/RNA exonuclease TatD-like n=1 Tax=Dillenia turbinata TaxID=194707 RepID=A0AAN8ZDB5_9MAGN